MANINPACNDGVFGPGSSCRSLDFTLYFEASILFIAVDTIFIILALWRCSRLWNRVSLIARSDLRTWLKSIASLLILSSSASVLGIYVTTLEDILPYIFRPAFSLSFVSSAVSIPLSYYEHSRSPTPSALILCYTVCKGLFISSMLRSFHSIGFARNYQPAFVALSITAGSHFFFFFVELFEKKGLFTDEAQAKMIGEATSSFISKALFMWLLPLMWQGAHTKLTVNSLGDIPEEFKAEPALKPLLLALGYQDAAPFPTPLPLILATLKAFGTDFFIPVIPRFILVLATFAQPLLVNRLIGLVQDPAESTERGWSLVGGFVCAFSVITICTAVYWQKVYAITVRYRAALVNLIHWKALRLAAHASRSVGTGSTSTYMSVDVERICEGVGIFHECCAAMFSIPLALLLLYQQASWAAFAPLGVIALFLLITSRMGSRIGRLQAAWLASTDKRVKLISSIVSQFLPIKMSGYEDLLSDKVTFLRTAETKQASRFFYVAMVTSALSNSATPFCCLAALGAYAGISQTQPSGYNLDVTRIFTILITVNLLSGPLNMLGQGLPNILAAYASLKRIQEFLSLEEKIVSQKEFGDDLSEKQGPTPEILVKISDGAFSWSSGSPLVLQNISISFGLGLHMVVGRVGSGKTSLLVSLLGESVLQRGILERPGTPIAYASQDAFIVSGTCRENILFGRPFIQDWYSAVIHACELDVDFARLPLGDQTVLQDRASTLSGGQRQRMSLARAIYAQTTVTLLDDVFSALDGETERSIFESMFGPSGLMNGKMCVLVTHNVRHLSSADSIIVLDHGTVTHRGNLESIAAAGYDVEASIGTHVMTDITNGDPGPPVANKTAETGDTVNDTDEDEESQRIYTYGWDPYKFYVFNVGRHRVMIIVLLISLFTAVRLGTQGFIKEWSQSNGHHLSSWLGGYVAFCMVGLITGIGAFCFVGYSATLAGSRNIHQSELKGVFRAPASFFFETAAGRIINRFSSDIFMIDYQFPFAASGGIATLTAVLGNLILIYIATPWLALSAPPMFFTYWLLMKFYLRTSKQLQQLEAASKSPLYSTFSNTLLGLEIIRAFGVQSHFENKIEFALNRSQAPYYYRFGGMRFLRTTLSLFTLTLAVGLASLSVGLRNRTSAGFLGIALSNLTGLSDLLSNLLMSYSQLENGTVSIQRIQEMACLLPETDPGADGFTVSTGKGSWPSKGTLVFENVSMRYKEGLDQALQNISFSIKSGQKLALCGRSGSGKSSIVMAIFRMIDQSLITGRVLMDGVDSSTIPLSLLRENISLVSQEPFLWHGSIRELLDIQSIHTDDDLWDALDRVRMKDVVSNLSDQLDTVVEDGGSFSRGERQLLCLARVLLRRTKIVVLDEATSSMDSRTDELIRQVVQNDLKDRTIIAVSHRLSSIIDYDQILVLSNGQILESGSPEDLLSVPTTHFFKLANAQGLPVDQILRNIHIHAFDDRSMEANGTSGPRLPREIMNRVSAGTTT